jgi:RNA polymerase sigma factor (sigma-70 family)
MLILKDWSNGLLLEKDEIVKERDVVHNEYRLGEGPSQRMITRSLPKLYPGSKYGVRMPIGLMSVIDNFKPKTLKKYYQKWYRHDNQAIIVVGDIDVDHFEQKVKELFSGIKVSPKAPKVVLEEVPDKVFSQPDAVDDLADRDMVDRLLSVLSEEERNLVVMKYREGYRNVEIAAELDMNPSTVSTRIFNAMAKMRSVASGW